MKIRHIHVAVGMTVVFGIGWLTSIQHKPDMTSTARPTQELALTLAAYAEESKSSLIQIWNTPNVARWQLTCVRNGRRS